MSLHSIGQASSALDRQHDRLRVFATVNFSLLFLPFFLVLLLTEYINFETSTRIHAVAHPFDENLHTLGETKPLATQNGEERQDAELWLSISEVRGRIVVTTSGSEFFSWPLAGPSAEEIQKLEAYLQLRAKQLVTTSVLRGQVTDLQNRAALSVDQRLTFHHIRPIIYALGHAGFSRYGFETRILK